MNKRKKAHHFKVHIAFTPSSDWDTRLKRVMELLLRNPSNMPEKGEPDNVSGRRKR